jgi:hypothetical protein
MWEHNFLVDQIGLVAEAPAKRAAILWTHDYQFRDDFQPEAYQIWTNLANWALDGQQGATIGFFPGYGTTSAAFDSVFALQEMFVDQGHTVIEIPDIASLPDPADLDLLIHTSEGAVDPPTIFANYAVPGIFFNAPNHDDTLIAKIGQDYPFDGATSLNIVAEHADHPVLEGLSTPVPWTGDLTTGMTLRGMGGPPPGGDVILTFTYTDPVTMATQERPALIVLDEGATLLGTLDLSPEGEGFIVGADLDAAFGGMANPRVLQLDPVDISGQTEDVQLTVALAATDADFEATDFLRVRVGQEGDLPEDFVTLAEYIGLDDLSNPCHKGVTSDGGMSCLSPSQFTDVTWNISELAGDISNLVVRFETLSTFPNEIYAIDDVRIFAGELGGEGIPGDYNGNGTVEQADLDLVLLNWGTGGVPGGWTNDLPEGNIDQAELDGVLLNWGNTAALGSAAGVPEPSSLTLVLLFVCAAAFRRRSRTK